MGSAQGLWTRQANCSGVHKARVCVRHAVPTRTRLVWTRYTRLVTYWGRLKAS